MTTGTTSVSVNTTAPASGELQPAPFGGSKWFKRAGGTALLALVIFFIPGSTRKWRHMVAACMLADRHRLYSRSAVVHRHRVAPAATAAAAGVEVEFTSKTTPTVDGVARQGASIAVNTPVSVTVTVAGSGMVIPSGSCHNWGAEVIASSALL